MANEKENGPITITSADVDKAFNDYAENLADKGKIEVTFDGLNNPAPLDVLRIVGEKTADISAELVRIAEGMCDKHVITFTAEGQKIKQIAYNRGGGNSLSLLLSDEVYLLDALITAIYAVLLKKLTPHLKGSN